MKLNKLQNPLSPFAIEFSLSRLRCIFALTLTTLIFGCSSPAKIERNAIIRNYRDLEAQLPTTVVDASDGISEVEAYKVARDYFTKTLNACGGIGLPQEEELLWRVPIHEGIAGQHIKDVVVRKSDGSYSVVVTTLR